MTRYMKPRGIFEFASAQVLTMLHFSEHCHVFFSVFALLCSTWGVLLHVKQNYAAANCLITKNHRLMLLCSINVINRMSFLLILQINGDLNYPV